jgi:hypothetical protein
MELRRLCAYNQTRECFLGLEVAAADLPYAGVANLLGEMALKSGEGLWIAPFRGIPETNIRDPLDLIYLDQDCRVIEAVESFPTFRVTSSSPQVASVLALPTHSIYSSQTQQGDQMVLCVAEEMQRRLERFSGLNGVSGVVRNAAILRAMPLWSGGLDLTDTENRPEKNSFPSGQPQEQVYEMDLAGPGMKAIKQPRNWLERWWSPDPRKAPDLRTSPRETLPGVAAYYWTGTVSQAHTVKDISSTGLYVMTEERWYPGTLILMTLQADGRQEGEEHSIAVHSRAVRWGNDGVGLQFIPEEASAASRGTSPLAHGVDKNELDQFLSLFRKSKS